VVEVLIIGSQMSKLLESGMSDGGPHFCEGDVLLDFENEAKWSELRIDIKRQTVHLLLRWVVATLAC
jgi:hypothetical protein